MWSILREPVMNELQWSSAQASLVFSLMLPINIAGTMAAGFLSAKRGCFKVAVLGCAFMVGGVAASALATKENAFLFYITYSVAGGFGSGLIYNSVLTIGMRSAPQRSGLASGILLCSYGSATILLGPLIEFLMRSFETRTVFVLLGAIFSVGFSIGLRLLRAAPSDAEARATEQSQTNDDTPRRMLRRPSYYALFVAIVCLSSGYLLFTPALKSFAIQRDLSANAAVLAVSMTGAASAIGRLVSACLTDRMNAIMVGIGLLAVEFLALCILCVAGGGGFLLAIALISFCYGGCSGITPALTQVLFGKTHLSENLGMVMISVIVSGLLCPSLTEALGTDGLPNLRLHLVSLALAVLGAVMLLLLLRGERRKKRAMQRTEGKP